MAKKRKLSLGEELRATFKAAQERKRKAESASAEAARKALEELGAGFPERAQSYCDKILFPALRRAAEAGSSSYCRELPLSKPGFADAVVLVLKANGLEASVEAEYGEDPNSEVPTRYRSHVITVDIC